MSFTKCLVLALSIVASVNALSISHAARRSVHHRSLAARVVEPGSTVTHLVNRAISECDSSKKKKKHCPSPSEEENSSTSTPTPTFIDPPQSTKEPKPPKENENENDDDDDDDDDNSSGGGGGAGSQHGEGTYYDTGLGACGITNIDSDLIVAVPDALFTGFEGYTGGNPNKNPICGRKIKAYRGDKSVVVTVTDLCPGCQPGDLDLSPAAFDILTDGNRGLGRVDVTWDFV